MMHLGTSISLTRPANRRSESGVLELTNVQKLSLPANTPFGTRVRVIDRSNSFTGTFNGVFTDGDPYGGAAKADPTWAVSIYAAELNLADSWIEVLETDINIFLGGSDNPTPTQMAAKVAELYNTIEGLTATANGASFTLECAIPDFIPFASAEQGNYDAVFALGSGIVQQLAAPSTAQGGVFVPEFGIFAINEDNGHYVLLGDEGSENNAILPDFNHGEHKFGFVTVDVTLTYYSDDDVATPDLATNWKNASDDSPASITVTSVSVDDLNSGLKAGTITSTFQPNGSSNGRVKYSDVSLVVTDVTWSGTLWTGDEDYNESNVAFPFSGTPEIPTVKSRPAGEANWEVVS